MQGFRKGLLAMALSVVLGVSAVQAHEVPVHEVPVPKNVSPALQKQIASGLPMNWAQVPQSKVEWRRAVNAMARAAEAKVEAGKV